MIAPLVAPVRADPAPPDESWRLDAGEPIVAGRIALLRLGGGERYEAYVAWDERLHATVVAKLLRPHLVDDERSRRALEDEATALRALEHPALVRSFGAVLDGQHPHLVLEHLDGPRLSTLIRRTGPLAVEQVVPLARQLVAALAFMHHEGWLHLDVKPRNIIMTGAPRLIDLSLARSFARARRVRSPIGTDAYMAPEQCDAARFGNIGPATDIWGLGATVFETLTGGQAFPGADGDRFPQLTQEAPPLPRHVPRELASAIGACLAREPRERPDTDALDDALESLDEWSSAARRRFR
jgi:serine/threonine protein kinase